MTKFALGIDLGTTFSSVSIIFDGSIDIISDKSSNRSIPSIVNYSKKKDGIKKIEVGRFAEKKLDSDPKNTIYDTKRMLATKYNDPNIEIMKTKWPFKIEESESSNILISLDRLNEKLEPYQVSGEILKYLAELGNSRLSAEQKTKDVVITIPANFGNDKRNETLKAAEYANLNVLRIINEPTAAGIAYKYKRVNSDKRYVFVFDFGGGTLDVSLLYINNDEIIVKATNGDMFLGGRDFDENMIEYLVKKLELDENFKKSPKKMSKFRDLIIDAKIQLSNSDTATICPEDDEFEEFELTLDEFEEINKDLIDRILIPIENILNDVKNEITKDQIDDVIFVGGSSNMQFVKRKLKEFFNKEPFIGLNPEEAVVTGAGIVASLLANQNNLPESFKKFKFCDVCPFTIGTSDVYDNFGIFIKKIPYFLVVKLIFIKLVITNRKALLLTFMKVKIKQF